MSQSTSSDFLEIKTTSHNGKIIGTYTLQYKLDAVRYAEGSNNTKAAEKFKVN